MGWRMTWLNRRAVAELVIIACGLLVFHNSFGNGFHYDDEHSIVENPHIRSLSSIPDFFVDAGTFSGLTEARMYRPLLLVTYALNYAVGGYEVAGYHLVNLLLHLLNAWLVWALGRRLLVRRELALTAALLFVAHPLMSEPVNYISSRSSLLAALFYLLGFLLLTRDGERRPYLLIAACYLAALGTKSIAFTFPLMGALYLLLEEKKDRWRLLIAPVVLSGFYLMGTRAIVAKALLQPVREYGAQLATQIKATVYYLWTAAMPVRLSVEPGFGVAKGFGEVAVVLAGLLLISLFFAGAKLRRREKKLVFCAGWFFATLLPTALVPLYVLVNEHRLYLPMVGAALGIGALLQGSRRVRRVWLLVLAVLALQCIQRNRIWETEETLWADAVAKGPQMPRPYVNLGKACLEQGRYREAIAVSRQALDIDPALARAHYNIGTGHLKLDEQELAVAHYLRALEIQPDLVQAQNNLGNTYQEQGRYADAVRAYRKALDIQISPSFYHNLANAFLQQGRSDSARFYFRRALRLDPDVREPYKGLAKACLEEELLQTAIEVLQEGLQRWPQDATFLLLTGDAYAALGKEEKAIRAYRQAGRDSVDIWLKLGNQARRRGNWQKAQKLYERSLAEGGEEARVYNALGEAHFGQGRMPEALQAFRRAAQLDPLLAVAYANIGRVYLKHERALEAIAALERAVELAPAEGDVRGLLADAYWRGSKREKASETYRQAIELAPGNAGFYHNLGFVYEQEGHRKEAERMYRASLVRDPNLEKALFNLGYLLLEQERFEAAVSAYQKLLELQPEYGEGYVNLASAFLGLKRKQQAIKAYERFLQIRTDDDDLRRKVERNLEGLKGEGGR